ncbi:hypothetical protein CSUI_004983 [Cystoisospora suis]|uniref:Uncharacterized protein n=1 Tax=Cystoisospora suis TaxID=483139 RepID=A0A2C6KZ02_9APIC|nr:hypothetical protein CSUI_004983 [Cystoisospora suis]
MPPPSVAAFLGRMGESDEPTGSRNSSSTGEGDLHSVCSVPDGDARVSGARRSVALIPPLGDTSAARSGILSEHNGGQVAEIVSGTSSSRTGPSCGIVVEGGGGAADSSSRKCGSTEACVIANSAFRGGKGDSGTAPPQNSHRSCSGGAKQAAHSPYSGKHAGAVSNGQGHGKGHSGSNSQTSKMSGNPSGERHSHSSTKQSSSFSGRDTQSSTKASSSSTSSGKKVACGFDSELSARELRKIKYYEEMFARLANEERQKQSGVSNVPSSNPSSASGASTSPGNYSGSEKGPKKHPSHARLTGDGGSGPGKLSAGSKPGDSGDSRESQLGSHSGSAVSASSGVAVQTAVAVSAVRNSVCSSGSKRKHSRVIDSTDDEGPPSSPLRVSVKRVATGKGSSSQNSVTEQPVAAVTSNPPPASGGPSDGTRRSPDKVTGRQSGDSGGGGTRGDSVLGNAHRQSQHLEARGTGPGNSSVSASTQHPHSCGARSKTSPPSSGLRSLKGGEGAEHAASKAGEGLRKKRRVAAVSPSAEAANSSSSSSSSSGTSSSDSSDSESGFGGGRMTNNRCLPKSLQRSSGPSSRSGSCLAGSGKRLPHFSKKRFHSRCTTTGSLVNGGPNSAPATEDSRRLGGDGASSTANGPVHSSGVKIGGDRRDCGGGVVAASHHSAQEGGVRKASAGSASSTPATNRHSSTSGGGGTSAGAAHSGGSSVSVTVSHVKGVASCSQRVSPDPGEKRSCSRVPAADGDSSGAFSHQSKCSRGGGNGANSEGACGKPSEKEKGSTRVLTSVDTSSSLRTKQSSAGRPSNTIKAAPLNSATGGGGLTSVEQSVSTGFTPYTAASKTPAEENHDRTIVISNSSSSGAARPVPGIKQEKDDLPVVGGHGAGPTGQQCLKESQALLTGDTESTSSSVACWTVNGSLGSPPASVHQSGGRCSGNTVSADVSHDARQSASLSAATSAMRKTAAEAEKESSSSARASNQCRMTSAGLVKRIATQEIGSVFAADTPCPPRSSSTEIESRKGEGDASIKAGNPRLSDAGVKNEGELPVSQRRGGEFQQGRRNEFGSENSHVKSRVDSAAATKRGPLSNSDGLSKATSKGVSTATGVSAVPGVAGKGAPVSSGSPSRMCGSNLDRLLCSASSTFGSASAECDPSEAPVRGSPGPPRGGEANVVEDCTETKAGASIHATASRDGGSVSDGGQDENELGSGRSAVAVGKSPGALLACSAIDTSVDSSLEKGGRRGMECLSDSERRSQLARTSPRASAGRPASRESGRSSSKEEQGGRGPERLESLGSSGGTARSGSSSPVTVTCEAGPSLSAEETSQSCSGAHRQEWSQLGGHVMKNDDSVAPTTTVADASNSRETSPRGAGPPREWELESRCSPCCSAEQAFLDDRNSSAGMENVDEGEHIVSYAPLPLLTVARAVSAQPLTNTPLPSVVAGRRGGGGAYGIARRRASPFSQSPQAAGSSQPREDAVNGNQVCRSGTARVGTVRHHQRSPESPVLTAAVPKDRWLGVGTGEQAVPSQSIGGDWKLGASASAHTSKSFLLSAVLSSESPELEHLRQKENEGKSGVQKSAADEVSGVVILANGGTPRHLSADRTAGMPIDNQGYAEACCSVVPVRDWRRLLLGREQGNWKRVNAESERCESIGDGGTKQARTGMLIPCVSQPCSGAETIKKLPLERGVSSISASGGDGFASYGAASEKRSPPLKGVGLLASVSNKPGEQETLGASGGGPVKRTGGVPEPLVLHGRWLTSLSWKAQLLRKVYNAGRPVR